MRVRTRHVALALSLAVLAAFTVGTGAFSSMTGERGVAISVADDEAAYLGIDVTEDIEPESGGEITLLTLTDRFATDVEPIEVTVTNTSDDASVNVTVIGIDSAGNQFDVTASIECDESATSETKTVQIEASGPGVAVLKNKSVTVGCTAIQATTTAEIAVASSETRTNTTASPTDRTNTTTPSSTRTE